jgi:hypothetical protein
MSEEPPPRVPSLLVRGLLAATVIGGLVLAARSAILALAHSDVDAATSGASGLDAPPSGVSSLRSAPLAPGSAPPREQASSLSRFKSTYGNEALGDYDLGGFTFDVGGQAMRFMRSAPPRSFSRGAQRPNFMFPNCAKDAASPVIWLMLGGDAESPQPPAPRVDWGSESLGPSSPPRHLWLIPEYEGLTISLVWHDKLDRTDWFFVNVFYNDSDTCTAAFSAYCKVLALEANRLVSLSNPVNCDRVADIRTAPGGFDFVLSEPNRTGEHWAIRDGRFIDELGKEIPTAFSARPSVLKGAGYPFRQLLDDPVVVAALTKTLGLASSGALQSSEFLDSARIGTDAFLMDDWLIASGWRTVDHLDGAGSAIFLGAFTDETLAAVIRNGAVHLYGVSDRAHIPPVIQDWIRRNWQVRSYELGG